MPVEEGSLMVADARARDGATDEVPRTLDEPAPQVLGTLDQLGLWANLGVSLLGFTGAVVVLQPGGPGTERLSLLAAFVAIVVGTVIGAAAIALAAVPGAQTGQPAMVLLRGLFGVRPSYALTGLNIVQMLGWGTFELVTIATAAEQLLPAVPRWAYVLVGGVLSTALAIWPLGSVRLLRRYVTVLMVLALTYLFVQLLREPLPSAGSGGWAGFTVGVDTTLAVAISWVPVAADYTRHSRTPRAAAVGSFFGFGLTQIACYTLGLIALLTVGLDSGRVFAAFLAVPLGWLAFSVLATRELDQSFINVYSTTVSVQNVRPRWDRRLIALVAGALITALAVSVDIYGYASFLSLLGSLFVPMFAVLVVDYFAFDGRRRWDLSDRAPARPAMLVPWAVGFVTYQLINPGDIGWWSRAWSAVADTVGLHPHAWMSASLCSFLVASLVTVLVHGIARTTGRSV